MTSSRIALTLSIAVFGAFAGCAGGAGNDGRAEAIQTALDAKPPIMFVPSGRLCGDGHNLGKFKGLSYVKMAPAGAETNVIFGSTQSCTMVTWNKSANVGESVGGNDDFGRLPIGHFVVDKVGEEQDGQMGGKVTPFKVHFEWNAIGKDMLARHLATTPATPTDQMAQLHKDADGKWVAQIVN